MISLFGTVLVLKFGHEQLLTNLFNFDEALSAKLLVLWLKNDLSSFGWDLFLINSYKASLNIKHYFSFVIVPSHSCY